MPEALDWPDGFARTPACDREPYPGGFQVTRSEAFDSILDELRKMDARNVQIQTAAPHTAKAPHRPYKDRDPDDPSVVVYFERDGTQFAVPCDRWDNLRDNARAIALYLDAKRALERYGVQTVESEFATQALPSGEEDAIAMDEPPHEALGIAPNSPDRVIRAAYQEMVKDVHPDQGGTSADLQRVKRAKEELMDRAES